MTEGSGFPQYVSAIHTKARKHDGKNKNRQACRSYAGAYSNNAPMAAATVKATIIPDAMEAEELTV